tara:strand:+ start:208 stop:660 length:453 start_codon:yes stop_codon:yes gene_type:complete
MTKVEISEKLSEGFVVVNYNEEARALLVQNGAKFYVLKKRNSRDMFNFFSQSWTGVSVHDASGPAIKSFNSLVDENILENISSELNYVEVLDTIIPTGDASQVNALSPNGCTIGPTEDVIYRDQLPQEPTEPTDAPTPVDNGPGASSEEE